MNTFLNRRGNYKNLLTYQKSQVIYDFTYCFCERFFKKFDRTIDQMVQAARSGKQNIVEGAKAGATSTETEIRLTNVARASLEELLEDYHDYIRVKNLKLWEKDSKEAAFVSKLSSGKVAFRNATGVHQEISSVFIDFAHTRSAETCANIMVCLINQCNFLLDRQVKSLEESFVKEGGIKEKMFKARKANI